MFFVAHTPLTEKCFFVVQEYHQFFLCYIHTPNVHIHGDVGLYQEKNKCVILCKIVEAEINKCYFQIGSFSLLEDEIVSSQAKH